ncbi:gas vesicle protein GvpG [Dactylosporangium aurantiacum]|uniref:Gas vesicle protein GvpG n=1 Tax=Dactylosporangium aurantiacum TaxID=35754 RepID=A0A9Q9ICD0_9ACTN|nr:gas vesicle protein GvpG [Dactylosporangium aurantiacum]MDG6107115.1 gas vesicle protein GvpG [Dactylosporangium aurantiacum]UWZ51412.1 gas vesicle protein GvpG [Dactylosporangium aurantiacum]
MGLLLNILTLPYAPVRAVTAIAEVLLEQAEQELYSPQGVRRQLEALDEAVARGELSEDDRHTAEQEILDRVATRSTG